MILNYKINTKATFYYSKSGDQSGHNKDSITPREYLNLQLKAGIFDKETSERVLTIINRFS